MRISATHHYGYHPGEFFYVAGVAWFNSRPCFLVEIKDTMPYDHWPVYDPWDPYEFEDGN